MADRIWLNMQDLDDVNAGLKSAIAEFTDAAKTNDDLEDAVGRPDDRSGLRDKVGDFESDWNDKRGKLQGNLDDLQKHLQGIIDGWRKWDKQAQEALQSSAPDNRTTSEFRMGGPAPVIN